MADNQYNYSDSSLSGSSSHAERLVADNLANDPEKLHQPRTTVVDPGLIPSTVDANTLPAEQVIKNFDARKSYVWEVATEYGREGLTYSGIYIIEFTQGNEAQAKAWRLNRLNSGDNTFREYLRKGSMMFELSDIKTKEEMERRGLDLDTLRKAYTSAVEITPYFKDIERDISKADSTFLIKYSLEELIDEKQANKDLSFFTNTVGNQPARYFGEEYTGGDIGFYYDNAGNMRISYDPIYIYKSRPLLTDLTTLLQPDDYVVARYPTGMIQFVIVKDAAAKLVEEHKTELALTVAYNNPRLLPDNFVFGDFPGFEKTLELSKGVLVDSNTIFGFSTNDGKKVVSNG